MKRNDVPNTEEREIEIKVLFAYILKEWRKILAVSLILGVLLAGYKGYKISSNNSMVTDSTSEAAQKYIEDKKTAEADIAKTKASIEDLDKYMHTSVLANVDPYNETVTTANVSIGTSSRDTTTSELANSTALANQIVQAYSSFIDSIDYSQLTDTLELSEQEIRELVIVTSDNNSDNLNIKVVGSDSKMTEEIMTFLLKQLNEQETAFKSQYGDYNAIKTSPVTNVVVDDSMISKVPMTSTIIPPSSNRIMANSLLILSTMKTQLTSQEKALTTLISTGPVSTGSLLKSVVKYGLAGVLGGIVLMIIVYAFKYALAGTVVSDEDLKSIYGIKTLSILPMKISSKKVTKLDEVAYRKIDSSYGISEDVSLEKAAINISGYSGDMKSLLLVGVDSKRDLDELTKQLKKLCQNVTFTITTNVNMNSSELNKLKNAAGTIIVAERNTTKMDDLHKTIETIHNWEKPIVGSIVL